jgi:hypothetical protein
LVLASLRFSVVHLGLALGVAADSRLYRVTLAILVAAVNAHRSVLMDDALYNLIHANSAA